MKPLEEIKKEIEEELSQKRYEHSVSAMKKAIELAIKYGEDEEKAAYTALIHDIAKEMTKEEYYMYAEKNNIKFDEFDKYEIVALHGKIGADIAKKRYGFTQEMQNAICYHTTGRADMTLLDKIVYLADKTEETRDYEGVEKLRNVMKSKGLDEAILWDIDNLTIPKMIKKQKMIHPDSLYARNDIILKLKK